MQILVALCIIGVGAFLVTDPVKSRVLYCVSALVLFVNFNNECNQIMQFTNRIKDYAKLLLTERLLLLVSVLILLTTGFRSFPAMYTAKVVSVTSTFLLSAYLCRRFLRPTFYPAKTILSETAANISVGIKLMFANIASMLIIGAVRYGISIGWDVSTFGKVSLTLGISNFLMVFINAVSIVLFPMLKHVEQDKLAPLYIRIHSGLSYALLAMLITYFPLKSILSWWLPKYAPSLVYMAVLFPVCMYESKVALLVNTYLKSMRQEFLMLKINVVSVVVSVVTTLITVKVLHSLDCVVFSIVFLYAFRCFLAEFWLQKLLELHLAKDMVIETVMVLVFIISGWVLNSWWCTVIYGVAYAAYTVSHRKRARELVKMVRENG